MAAMKGGPAKDVEAYLAGVPAAARASLKKLRSAIKAAMPEGVEGISYRMPVYKLGTTPVVGFATAKEHCSLYVMSPAVMDAHKAQLKRYDTSKGTVRFPHDEPLPAALVKKLVVARVKETKARKKR